MKKYRAKKYRFLDKENRTTRVIYTPQVLFEGEWCCFKDSSSFSGIIEHDSKEVALKNAKELADS